MHIMRSGTPGYYLIQSRSEELDRVLGEELRSREGALEGPGQHSLQDPRGRRAVCSAGEQRDQLWPLLSCLQGALHPVPCLLESFYGATAPVKTSPQGRLRAPRSPLIPLPGPPQAGGNAVTWAPTPPLDPQLDLVPVIFATSGLCGPGRVRYAHVEDEAPSSPELAVSPGEYRVGSIPSPVRLGSGGRVIPERRELRRG